MNDIGLPPIDWDAEPSHFIRFAWAVVKLFKYNVANGFGIRSTAQSAGCRSGQ